MPKRTLRIRAASPTARDPAGAFRFASGLIALAGAGGALGALLEPTLSRRRRVAAAVVASATALVALRGAREPKLAAQAFLDHPTATLVAGAAPLAVSPLLGRRFNAFHMLSIVGVGAGAAVLERERYPAVAAVSSGFWVAQAGSQYRRWRELVSDEKFEMTFIMVPLAFWAVARITPDVLTAAREFGQLQDKLDAAEEKERQLLTYRAALERGFVTVRHGLELTRRGIERIDVPEVREDALDWLHRVSGRLDERAAVLDAGVVRHLGESNVEALLRKRAEVVTRLEPAAPDIVVDATVGRVSDGRTLALIGSVAASGLSNAVRHSVDATRIDVRASLSSDRLILVVEDDGASTDGVAVPSFGSAGLGHLRDEARALQGELSWGPREMRGWAQRLEAPVEPAAGRMSDLVSERTTLLLDRALVAGVRACAVMVLAMAAEGRQMPREGLRRSRVLALTVTAAYEVLDRRHLLERWGTPFLAAAAAVSAICPHHEHSLWSGWANAALSRHGLRCTHAELQALTAAHVLAIAVSYRGGWRQGVLMASHQMTTCMLGPLSIVFGAGRAIRALDRQERALRESLTATEQLHETAEAIHSAHPVPAPLERLEQLMTPHDSEAADALRDAQRALSTAATELRDPGPSDFAEQFARTVAARVWPAEVDLEINDKRLEELGGQATVRMEFQRLALSVADRLGDTLVAQFPKDWRARSQLQSVHLFITGDHRTRSLCIRATPVSTTRRPPHQVSYLAEALSDAGGILHEGFDDKQIRLSIPVT